METLSIERVIQFRFDRITEIVAKRPIPPWLYNQVYGRGHYRLLASIVKLWPHDLYFEGGTAGGASLMSMAYTMHANDGTGSVHSCEVNPKLLLTIGWSGTFNFQDRFTLATGPTEGDINHPANIDRALKSRLCFIDANHQGETELEFIDAMIEGRYKGLIIMDDTRNGHLLPAINKAKAAARIHWDLTEHFHESGTMMFDLGRNLELC